MHSSGIVPKLKGLFNMKKELSASVWQEGEWFVAQALETAVASQGCSVEEALNNLREALALHFETPVATALPEIRRIEIEVADS